MLGTFTDWLAFYWEKGEDKIRSIKYISTTTDTSFCPRIYPEAIRNTLLRTTGQICVETTCQLQC
jgi:hypothetical protein